MDAKTKQYLDIGVLGITIINITLFMFTLIQASSFLIVLSLCALYTYFIRKRIAIT